jgi:hypothetical protein
MFGKKNSESKGSLGDQLVGVAKMTARHSADAEDKKQGMTLGELDRFIHAALAQGAGEASPVQCQVNITAGIKSIWVKSERTLSDD